MEDNKFIKNLAVFIDFENFGNQESFDVKILIDKLKERGRLIVKRAYADWGRFSQAKHNMLQNSVELIEMPSHAQGKNSADIKLVVDALETAITKPYIDTIVVVSGDSDYTPLISKLREYNKYVLVIGAERKVSRLIAGYCDELIFYSSLVGTEKIDKNDIGQAFKLLQRAVAFLEDQGKTTISSLVKSYMKQLDAAFDETNYGFAQFKHFAEAAERQGLVKLVDHEHGDSIITLHTDYFKENADKNQNSGQHMNSSIYDISIENRDISTQIDYEIDFDDNKAKLLFLIGWAIRVNRSKTDTMVSYSILSSTIRQYFDKSFDLSKYGYSSNGGFKTIISNLSRDNYVTTSFSRNLNQYFAATTRKLEEYLDRHDQPHNFSYIRQAIILNNLRFTINREDVFTTISNMDAILTEVRELGLDGIKLQELLDLCRNKLHIQGIAGIFDVKVLNTILKSGGVRLVNGQAVTDLQSNETVGKVAQLSDFWEQCVVTIDREVMANYGESVDYGLPEVWPGFLARTLDLKILESNTPTETGLAG